MVNYCQEIFDSPFSKYFDIWVEPIYTFKFWIRHWYAIDYVYRYTQLNPACQFMQMNTKTVQAYTIHHKPAAVGTSGDPL